MIAVQSEMLPANYCVARDPEVFPIISTDCHNPALSTIFLGGKRMKRKVGTFLPSVGTTWYATVIMTRHLQKFFSSSTLLLMNMETY